MLDGGRTGVVGLRMVVHGDNMHIWCIRAPFCTCKFVLMKVGATFGLYSTVQGVCRVCSVLHDIVTREPNRARQHRFCCPLQWEALAVDGHRGHRMMGLT